MNNELKFSGKRISSLTKQVSVTPAIQGTNLILEISGQPDIASGQEGEYETVLTALRPVKAGWYEVEYVRGMQRSFAVAHYSKKDGWDRLEIACGEHAAVLLEQYRNFLLN